MVGKVAGGSWYQRHRQDNYVKKAQQEGHLSRAVYKLIELQQRHQIIEKNQCVVELGAAPGSWTAWVSQQIGDQGWLVALDLLAMTPPSNGLFIQGDFREQTVLEQVLDGIGQRSVNLILSDMAPNLTGIRVADQAKISNLAELTLELADLVLAENGHMIMKTFQGADFQKTRQTMQRQFATVRIDKPKASRASSTEVYLIGRHYKKQSAH